MVNYVAKEKEVGNEKSINGVMRVFGRFMKRINSDPEEGETGQPPSYSEAVQDTSEAEQQQPANLAVNDDVPVKETREASTWMDVGIQVDPEEMAETEKETLEEEEDALPESERAPDVEEKDEE